MLVYALDLCVIFFDALPHTIFQYLDGLEEGILKYLDSARVLMKESNSPILPSLACLQVSKCV